ncbi:MAG: hypothetical protein MJY82_07085 [Fibrobacter sp.]|nr:hypothetical protein [Fibrobacter sp.]
MFKVTSKLKVVLKCAGIAGAAITMFSACSDDPSVAGTAVEPNQNPIAYEDASSSSIEQPSSSVDGATSSSSEVQPASSSLSTPRDSSDNAHSSSSEIPPASSSSNTPSSSSDDSSSPSIEPQSSSTQLQSSSDFGDGDVPIPQEPTNRLSDFIWQYNTRGNQYNPDIEFDENVLAYHLVGHDNCEQGKVCDDTAPIYEEFRHARLNKDIETDVIKVLFPMTGSEIKSLSKPLKCPLHLLNIATNSNTGFVLTGISADTLTIADLEISSSCDVSTEQKVFGILFMYCGEFSTNVVIEHQKPSSATSVCVPDYEKEWMRYPLLKSGRDYE